VSGSPAEDAAPSRGVLLDLDGTLYVQRPLQARMLTELLAQPFAGVSPAAALRALRRLRVFRHVREELRALGHAAEPLEDLQYAETARRLGDDPDAVRATVAEWIFERPLRHLARHVRPGARAALASLAQRGVPLGVFSDYPVDAKLEALGLADLVPLRVCATEPAINAFKPHPRGFVEACARLGLPPSEVLYVGDRAEVDGAGARAAGMRCAIVSDRGRNAADGYLALASFDSLTRLVAGG
jgi:HAD superfamily hydrolase (TIGR01509 family)